VFCQSIDIIVKMITIKQLVGKYSAQMVLGLLCLPQSILAQEQQSQLWLDASINDDFAKHEHIDYSLEIQSRFVNQAGYEVSFISGGFGYRQTDNLSFWLGYEWIAPNVLYDKPHADRIWEQIIWIPFENKDFTIRTRTLLEQTHLTHESQWSNHLSEKISFYFPDKFFNMTPLIYNEIFIKLNNPTWLEGTDTIEENKIFIGLDIPFSKTAFIEAGYIQQFLFNEAGNISNPVLYVGINFNPSGRTFPQYVR
jgi:hypothetical protein